jgi:type IV secretory pathway protease TraF
MGVALERDRFDRPMPVWQGCRLIAAHKIFLMNTDAPTSLDGRYFGPMPSSSILGAAVLLWTVKPASVIADGAAGRDD